FGNDLGFVADPRDAGDLFAVELRGDVRHDLRKDVLFGGERLQDARVDDLPGDVREEGRIDRAGRFGEADPSTAVPRVPRIDDLASAGDELFEEPANRDAVEVDLLRREPFGKRFPQAVFALAFAQHLGVVRTAEVLAEIAAAIFAGGLEV